MKYDFEKKPTKGATRALNAFVEAMYSQLSERAFEKITVNGICETSGYPRATFYNYFDDKYDLLDFYLQKIVERIFADDKTFSESNSAKSLLDGTYDLLARYEPSVRKLLRLNGWDGYFFDSCRLRLIRLVKERADVFSSDGDIPRELLAEHYCNTLLLVFQWSFGRSEHLPPKERVRELVERLLYGRSAE